MYTENFLISYHPIISNAAVISAIRESGVVIRKPGAVVSDVKKDVPLNDVVNAILKNIQILAKPEPPKSLARPLPSGEEAREVKRVSLIKEDIKPLLDPKKLEMLRGGNGGQQGASGSDGNIMPLLSPKNFARLSGSRKHGQQEASAPVKNIKCNSRDLM